MFSTVGSIVALAIIAEEVVLLADDEVGVGVAFAFDCDEEAEAAAAASVEFVRLNPSG